MHGPLEPQGGWHDDVPVPPLETHWLVPVQAAPPPQLQRPVWLSQKFWLVQPYMLQGGVVPHVPLTQY